MRNINKETEKIQNGCGSNTKKIHEKLCENDQNLESTQISFVELYMS